MKKYFKTTTLASLTVLLLATGCTKNYNYWTDNPDGENNRITLSSEVQFGATPRIQDEQIVNGQSLSLFVTRAGSVAEGDQLYQNNRITANGAGGFTYRIPMYYPADGGDVAFYAVHPYDATASLETPHSFTVQTDQTILNSYLNSDLLFGVDTNVSPQVNAVPLTFYHKLSKIDFIITTSDPAIDLSALTSISVLGTMPQTTIDVQNGDITAATGSVTNVVAYGDAQNTGNPVNRVTGYTAIIIPQTVSGPAQLFQLNIGGTLRYYTHPTDYEFKSGNKYIVTMDVTDSSITIQSQIEDWLDGGSIGGPAGPQ